MITETEPATAGFFGTEQPAAADDVDRATVALLDRFLAEHPGGTERLIPLLHLLQEHLGSLPFPLQELVADRLGLSAVQVYSVLSFYHFFTTTPRGRFPLKVCMGTACFVHHAARILDALENTLQVAIGECTPDRLFSLERVRCIGACGMAPALMAGHDVHGHLDTTKVADLIDDLRQQDARGAQPGELSDV